MVKPRRSVVVSTLLVLAGSFALGCDDQWGKPLDATDASANNGDGSSRGDGAPQSDGGSHSQSIHCSEMSGISGIATTIVCVPEGMEGKSGSPAPLVIALHGYTQTAAEYRDTTEWHELARKHGFYVAFPQTNADLVNTGGLPAAWKWWKDFSDWTRQSFNPHYSPITKVVDAITTEHNVDADRVFITGLSAGGYMSTLMLAVFPDVFAAGASFSGGAANCDLKCTDSNAVQDWTRPFGYQPPTGGDVIAAHPSYWNDASTRKPRLLLMHGTKDKAVKPINLEDGVNQWTSALGIDKTPDNASLGVPDTLGGNEYKAYDYNGQVGVATVLMTGLGHGTPVNPGSAATQGGTDPYPSQTADTCSNVSDPDCMQDWTNTGDVYGPYEAAKFFGILNP